jgi:hypothetical protein
LKSLQKVYFNLSQVDLSSNLIEKYLNPLNLYIRKKILLALLFNSSIRPKALAAQLDFFHANSLAGSPAQPLDPSLAHPGAFLPPWTLDTAAASPGVPPPCALSCAALR